MRRGEIFWSQCRCGRAQPSNKSHQQGVDRMMSIWDQVVQSCPSREHNQPERGCRLAEGDGNGRVFFRSSEFDSSLLLAQRIWRDLSPKSKHH